MSLIKVWIKGDIRCALIAAKERHIELFNIKESTTSHILTAAEVKEEDREKVVMWFREQSDPGWQSGYVVGTLLMHE